MIFDRGSLSSAESPAHVRTGDQSPRFPRVLATNEPADLDSAALNRKNEDFGIAESAILDLGRTLYLFHNSCRGYGQR